MHAPRGIVANERDVLFGVKRVLAQQLGFERLRQRGVNCRPDTCESLSRLKPLTAFSTCEASSPTIHVRRFVKPDAASIRRSPLPDPRDASGPRRPTVTFTNTAGVRDQLTLDPGGISPYQRGTRR